MIVSLHGDHTVLETLLNTAILYLDAFMAIKEGGRWQRRTSVHLVSPGKGKSRWDVEVWGDSACHTIHATPSKPDFKFL